MPENEIETLSDTAFLVQNKLSLLVEEFKKLRKEKNLSNLKISAMSGISLSTVNSFFSGRIKNPSFVVIAAVARVLEFSLDSYVGITNKNMPSEEVERIMREHEKYKDEVDRKISEHAQFVQLNEVTIENYIKLQSAQEDRIIYQKKAIWLLRLGIAASVLINVALCFILALR